MSRVLLALLMLGACGGPAVENTPPPEYPGRLLPVSELRSPAVLGDAFALEQTVRSESMSDRRASDAREFRAVLQLHEGALTLVGFGPHGGRGFVLIQRGTDVEFESQLPEELPFPPNFMLHDIQRAWFRGLTGPLPDGAHTGRVADEHITERWRDGRLQERVVRRDDRPGEQLRVRYEGGVGGEEPPERVVLENGWYGYRLTLTTLSFNRL